MVRDHAWKIDGGKIYEAGNRSVVREGADTVKKYFGVALLAVMAVSFCGANPITWENGNVETLTGVAPWNAQDPSGWVVALYKDGGNGTMDHLQGGYGGPVVSSGDDLFVTSLAVDPGYIIEGQIWWSLAGVQVGDGLNVFSVVFNNTVMDNATWAVNVDDELFTVPVYSQTAPPTIYNAGEASAGEWYDLQVPEPGSMALMALGLMTLAARSIRRKK